MTSSLLGTIVAASRRATEEREAVVPAAMLPTVGRREEGAFRRALQVRGGAPGIIAECKRRSPSRGVLCEHYDPASIAASYADAGAVAISVLTEPTFFDGSLDHLRAVRAAVDLPVLRKDFIVTPYQIAEACAAGADAVLLIVAAINDELLRTLLRAADDAQVDALVEVHDERELARAVDAGAQIIGVNSRDLHTLEVDTQVHARLASAIPSHVLAVAESGIRSGRDMRALGEHGYRACLIGERLMATGDPADALAGLLRESRGAVA